MPFDDDWDISDDDQDFIDWLLFDDETDLDDLANFDLGKSDDGYSDGFDPEHPLGGEQYQKEFQDMQDKFQEWLNSKDFDRSTDLKGEVERIIDHYRINTGDFEDASTKLKLDTGNRYSLTDEATGGRESPFHVGDRVDPRAFDYTNLLILAYDRGLSDRVTSTIGEKGEHSETSFHYDGRAIDIRTGGLSKEQIDSIRNEFARYGVRCYDETDKSNWTEKTTGYHLHFDTATRGEVIERTEWKSEGGTRIELGIGDGWPLRRR